MNIGTNQLGSMGIGSSMVKTSITADGDIVTSGDVYARAFNTRDSIIHMRVEQIDNGMLMHLAFSEGEISKRFFIKDLSEMTDVLTAQIAARKIGV